MPTRLTQTGAEVQEDLYKIEDIDLATEEKKGLMSPEDKTKLDNIDAEIPTKLSDLEDDSTHRTVTDAEKTTWNNKSDFDGRYDSLTGRPYIPQRTSDLRNDSGFITSLVDNLVNYYLKNDADALFATIAALNAEVSRATGVEDALQGLVDAIVEKIPAQASADNPLADKAFVNSSIATATAEFKGTYNSVGELPVTGVDNNDYAFVRTVDAAGNTVYKRYKYNGSAWVFEYELNNSSFTSEQWAAVNSGITAALVSKLSGLPNADALTALLAGKQDTISDLESIRAGATAGASAYQKPSGGIPSSDMTEAVQTSLGKADTALQSESDPTVPAWAKAQNPPTEIFWATKGTTAISDIVSAIDGGKFVVLLDGVYWYILVRNDAPYYYFLSWNNTAYRTCRMNANTNNWSTYNYPLEKSDNKKTAITGNESSDTYYPSTKAVADYVASKAEVFVAEKGVTDEDDIIGAVESGKVVALKTNTIWYLSQRNESSSIVFDATEFRGSTVKQYNWTLNKSTKTWNQTAANLSLAMNLVTSFQSTPDDTHYPSEKLVKDSLDAIHQIPSGGTSGQVLSKASGTDYDTEWITPPSGSSDAVQYTPQTLTDAQKAQARVNIQTLHANFGETITPVTTGAETTQNKAQTLVGNEDDTTKYPSTKALADALGKWGVVSQTLTWAQAVDGGFDYTISNQVYGLIPKANIDLYEADGVGAVFNENTGYFELNELTDISYNEMRRIYAKTIGALPFSRNRDSQLAKYDERTTVKLSNPAGYSTSINHMFQAAAIHIAYLTDCNNLGSTANTFSSANYLKKVIGVLNASSWNDAAFRNCFSLESVTIKGLRSNMFFQNSQRLSLASVVCMVDNAANTSAITITLHATAYARCQADTTEYTYNGQTYTGILAYASAKNITIASA